LLVQRASIFTVTEAQANGLMAPELAAVNPQRRDSPRKLRSLSLAQPKFYPTSQIRQRLIEEDRFVHLRSP
jgi:hypothetical protein